MLRSRKSLAFGIPILVLSAVVALLLWGQVQSRPPGYAPTTQTVDPVEPQVRPTQYTLDARDKSEWAFFDIDDGRVVQSKFEDLEWDLAFRRTRLLTNSGTTNPAGAGGAVDLGEVPLETAAMPASVEFVVDELGGDNGDEPRNAAIRRWYNYDFIRHVIVPRSNVYLVRTSSGHAALIQFDSYYCDDGSPGCVTFTCRWLEGDGGDRTAQP